MPTPSEMKVAVCEYLIGVNEDFDSGDGRKFIPPTAINWLGDGIVSAILKADNNAADAADAQTVYVVEVDWGTMDGYPSSTHVHGVFSTQEAAEAEAQQCKDRRPFPALYAGVVPLVIHA